MVELRYIITSGYIDKDTIDGYAGKGWTFVATVPAKNIHPHAFDTDKATIFSKYTPYELEEELEGN
ncbi:hypothetical protein CPT_Moonbeam110 [Bacillus phage Moonbeam]|uniref:Uncharacterized protein n=1 Tax=Bacillus phage Moonbeam TaxID=1540091 RepID=A0A0A0RV61_9CAUD|nr:hypothetical protein CPT_Moonbeam110 [Bacillus phage Moonbeam]AIW03508.1 hypothetical protein CPT_Moonbeam110 [Bacillus phage Moonbeam]